MKNKKLNAALIWKQFEDYLVPQLRLSPTDRAVYSHLVRHSRLEGKPSIRFSINWLARGARLCSNSTRWALRRLITRGALLLVQCSKAGHVVEVRIPEEVRSLSPGRIRSPRPLFPPAIYPGEVDFLKNKSLRHAIHARERGSCFYCLRRVPPSARVLDHVVPRVMLGSNSYRNLVSCCLQCNSRKSDSSADDFLRRLYRERLLTAEELEGRLRALDALAAGKLPPRLAAQANPLTAKGARPFARQLLAASSSMTPEG